MTTPRWPTALAALTLIIAAGCAQRERVPDEPGPAEIPVPGAQPALPLEAPPLQPPPPMTEMAPALRVERDWLLQWFRDTPVRIAGDGDGALRIDVPLAFSFEPARSQVRPALVAVLDRVADSLRRQPVLRVSVGLVGDEAAPAALTQQRLASLRAALVARGVAGARMTSAPTAAGEPGVALRLSVEIAPLRAPLKPPASR